MMPSCECSRSVVPSTRAMSTPASAIAIGRMSTAGCLRTVMTWCSCGSKYLLTAAGPELRGAINLISRSQRVHERREGIPGFLQKIQQAMDDIRRAGGLREEVKGQEDDDRPGDDLLQHDQLRGRRLRSAR